MPISTNKLLYDIERKVNAVNSGRASDFRVVDLVSFFNDAYETVIEHLISEKDQNETIRNHLRPLLIPNACFECTPTDDCDVCSIEYPEDFYELINLRIEVCNDCCKGIKKFPIPKVQGDEVDEAAKNPYRKADYYFEQGLAYETTNGIRIYHGNEYNVLKVCIDYYKKIQRIEAADLVECEADTYRNWDGELIQGNVDFEIDSTYLNRKITDVAALFAENASKDYSAFSTKLQEILQINQLYK